MSILEAFATLPDPRRDHPNKLHKLIDIVVIALCAVIAKSETWEEIADYGEEKEDFFKSFLELPNGIPSHDTFNRVFTVLDPVAWQSCFMHWMQSLSALSQEKLIALDGKVLRGAKASGTAKAEDKQNALGMVSAWASENELVLGQVAYEKGHESEALLALLCLLDFEGASISIDAAGCHTEIVDCIIEGKADYVLSLKANQGKLFEDANWLFDHQLEHNPNLESFESFDVAHGREEIRTCWVISDLAYLEADTWTGLKSLVVINSEVLRKGKLSSSRRFFLSSNDFSPQQALQRVRAHWSIENQQHYPLDVLFHEDHSRTRKDFAPQNLATLRRFALNLLNLDTDTKISKRRKRLRALLNDHYLLKLLGIQLQG